MTPDEAWNAACQQLELLLDRASYDTWLRKTAFLNYEGGVYTIGVASTYARDMLQHRLYRNIRRVLSDTHGQPVEIRFELHRPPEPEPAAAAEEMPLFRLLAQQDVDAERRRLTLHEAIQSPRQPDVPESELNPGFVFDRFIVNKSSQMAYEAARAVAEYPATVYNPFLVYGGVGLGKTHLLQAIAHETQRRGLRTIYIPSEVFTNDLINAIRNRTTAMFREKYRPVDVLLVDDIQFIGGKESTQEEFFHTFNALVNFNKQVVLASDRHPRELVTLEDRLRSRFQGGLVADVQPPEFETRMAILRMWAKEKDVTLNDDVLVMVAQRVPGNIREMQGAFNQVAAQSRILKHRLPLSTAESTLQRYSLPRQKMSLELIIERVAQHYNLQPEDLTGKKRTEHVNLARQVAMYLCRDMTEFSLPQIGDAFGGRSHTTVLHGCNKMQEEVAGDRVLQARLEKLRRFVVTGRS
ncbi:MAG: chromosomal replication initiator protein DnaA [Anaerolineae bacterium]|nr:chromosomal replication initiator protein DnaA [Anaerolineae bacterium]